jgi:hypothetical protein
VALTPELMNQAYEREVSICRRVLSAHAEKARLKWSFSVVRGHLQKSIEHTVESGDFLTITAGGDQGLVTRDVVEQLRSLPSAAQGLMIAAKSRTTPPAGPVIAIDDGDAAGARTVALAARLAAFCGKPLDIFAVASSNADAYRITERARDVAGPELSMLSRRFAPGAGAEIAAAFLQLDPSFIVADLAGEPFGDHDSVRKLLHAAQAPVILLRPANRKHGVA